VLGAIKLLGTTVFALMLTPRSISADAAPNETVLDDPLFAARNRLEECTSPDEQEYTCHALASYRLGPDGKWSSSAEIPISESQAVSGLPFGGGFGIA
jgi:hypothetical protein